MSSNGDDFEYPPVSGDWQPDEVGAAGKRLVYAGFLRRAVARLLDVAILQLLVLPLVALAVDKCIVGGDATAPNKAEGFQVLFRVGTAWLYLAGMESSAWQATLGKLAMGIEVVRADGRQASIGRATARQLGHILSVFTLGLGYLMALFTTRRQALHDIFAQCLVVRSRPTLP